MMEELEKWRDCHKGQDMIVCGCGPSVAELPRTLDIPTIGVNDIWSYHECNYILMLDGPKAFTPNRVNRIAASKPEQWFLTKASNKAWTTQAAKPRKPMTLFDELLMPGVSLTTPSLAVGLAMFMGAKRVGLIGVDLKGHGSLEKRVCEVDRGFMELKGTAWIHRVQLWNLSKDSMMTMLPHKSLTDFLAAVPGSVA